MHPKGINYASHYILTQSFRSGREVNFYIMFPGIFP